MLDSNTILGIRTYLECEEYEHGLLTQNNDCWPCGTPIIYRAGILEADRRRVSTTQAYVLMPPSQRAGGVEYAQVHLNAISPVGLKPLCKNHKVITVSRFDISRFDRLLEFVRDVGGISLVIEYEAGRKAAAVAIKQLERFFKYSSLFYYNTWTNKCLEDKEDKFVCILTLLDIPYCMPLFNMRKVDGIGLSFTGALVKTSKALGYLHRTFRADFIYSNYEDNVFFVDGIAINSIQRPDISIYDNLDKLTGQHFEIGKPDKKRKKRRTATAKLVINQTDGGHSLTFPSDSPPSEISVAKWSTQPVQVSHAVVSESEMVEPEQDESEVATFSSNAIFHDTSEVIMETTPEGMIVSESPLEVNNGITSDPLPWEMSSTLTDSTDNTEPSDEPEEGGT